MHVEVELKLDIITGESRGFAFVSFTDEVLLRSWHEPCMAGPCEVCHGLKAPRSSFA